ncbi:MAG: response regulator [Planctomycetota bacterium]|nr:response regulator [Planctomycetota bacterium]
MVEPVSLPAFQPSIGPKTYEQEASDASLPTGLKILVVDDDERILKLVASFLDALGCQAVIFDSPISALEAVPRGEFDLMITDRLMPGMSGDHLAMRVRAIRPRMPILMLTGLGMQMRATGEVPQGVNLVLSKPISLARLQRGISVVLDL